MLTGEKVRLRARRIADAAALGVVLNQDVETQMGSAGEPWRPLSLAEAEARVRRWTEGEPDPSRADFAVEELPTGALAGSAALWGIDAHNRSAHLGYSLLPAHRGRGLGTDLIRVLCDYGFRIRGLNRLQIDTLADNEPSIRAAQKVGFTVEARLRETAWVGRFADEVLLGLLASDWARR